MRLDAGLVALADTRIISGNDVTTARKVTSYENDGHCMFVMTSGLRSARDKVLTYFDHMMAEHAPEFTRMYEAANAFGQQIRRVSQEDRASLEAGGLRFDIQCLVGGQLAQDDQPRLYLIYPEGNWIEISIGTPFHIIGGSAYGKPILRRALKHTDPLEHALKIGVLAFDSTRISAADVDFPIDIVILPRNSYRMIERRLEASELASVSQWWQDHLRTGIETMPSEWVDELIGPLQSGPTSAQASPRASISRPSMTA